MPHLILTRTINFATDPAKAMPADILTDIRDIEFSEQYICGTFYAGETQIDGITISIDDAYTFERAMLAFFENGIPAGSTRATLFFATRKRFDIIAFFFDIAP